MSRSRRAEREVARLVDRLTVKLGSDKVRRPQPHESHLPERASGWRRLPCEKVDEASSASMPRRHDRSALLDRPEAIDVIYATPEGSAAALRLAARGA